MPAAGAWRMPAEWAPHERTWMAWPSAGYTLGDTEEAAEEARATWADVALAVSQFEPVTLVVDPADVAVARHWIDEGVTGGTASTCSRPRSTTRGCATSGPPSCSRAVASSARSTGCSTGGVRRSGRRGAGTPGSVSSSRVAPGRRWSRSDLVNEGGGIHVDGLGTVLLTETVQLDPGRNPGLTRADVEVEMARTIGATTCIWLPRGLTRDYDEFGTRGHVDIVATFASPGVVLLHWQGDPDHPDHEVSVELEGLLSSARDARGEALEVVRVPAPKTLEDDEGPVDWSYINHLVVNDGVVACTYDDPQDADSLAVIERAYAGRRVVGVDARPLFDRGGGIHCITQQQPRA